MKFLIVINQEKLLKVAPDASLDDGAVIDVLQALFASASAAVEAHRITGPDGRRYTWIDYSHLLAEIPLLRGTTRMAISRIIKRLESWKIIATISPDHQRKFAAPGKAMEKLVRSPGDKSSKLYQGRYSPVSPALQLQGKSCNASVTYQDTTIKKTIDQRRSGDKSPPIESIGSIIKRRAS